MKEASVARRYAKALLEIGIKNQSTEAIGAELERVAALFEHRDLRTVLGSPVHDTGARRGVLSKLIERLSLSKDVTNFLNLALDRNRLGLVPEISTAFRAMADEVAGRVRAEVVSAKPLDSAAAAQLTEALRAQTGKEVILSKSVDAELIAGAITRIGSVVFDGSVRTQLQQIRDSLAPAE